MSKLFETSEINGMKLANRFVRSATWEGMAADDGACTPKLIDLMVSLAKGDVGLIITSHAYVSPEGQAGPWQLGVYKDELVSGLTEMTKAVHDHGGKIVIQLAHAGYFANAKLTGQTPIAPSNAEGFAKGPRQEMNADEIQGVVKAYGAAAKRAQTAGFDGVQIHCAHGYLLSQFLSPAFNQRKDEYGGDILNRARALIEVLREIRQVVGKDYPVLVKINCQDFIENGLQPEDSLQAGKMLVENGIDAIELSGGVLIGGKLSPSRMGIKSEEKEAYFQNEARTFTREVNVPLILVGGNRSFQVAERIVNEGVADYISLCRPLIREPDLVNRWKSGDLSKAACVSDNMCFEPARKGDGIYCLTEERERKKNSEGGMGNAEKA
ncbi:MAG: NADH:flavin oxidoreductase [Deltaproteobacteria bacterium]|nr:NADH:flavin oxidoreductase [Deltaproteobacteria bacterium]